MAPIVDGLEQEFGPQLAVRRINADTGDGPAMMRSYKILGHPAVLIVDANGQEVQRFIGPQPIETLTTVIKALER
jgi:thioredoxin-like negative regulator of GroEL